DLRLHFEVLPPGGVGIETRPLSDDPDRVPNPFRITHDVEAGHRRLPFVRPRERGQDLDRRRLACTVRAEQPEDRPRLYLEADAVERLNAARVCLLEIRCSYGDQSVLPISFDVGNVLSTEDLFVKIFEGRTDRRVRRRGARGADRSRPRRRGHRGGAW